MFSRITGRPGFQTSEWYVALLTAALNLANSSEGWVSYRQALVPSAAAVAYVVSRGLAKTEQRGSGGGA